MLLTWQHKHFGQANETPFATQYWRDQFRDRQIHQMILDGDYKIPEDLPEEAQYLLRELRRPIDSVDDIKPYTSFDDFKEYVSNIEEKRSSSPSGRHYGHYKTLLDDNESYLRIIHGILELALRNGVVLNR